MTASAIQTLRTDNAQARRFLKLLGKDPATTRLRAFPAKKSQRKDQIIATKGRFNLQLAERWNRDRGVYLVINEGGDKKASITSCIALFVEWDDQPLDWQVTAWQELGLPEPTVIVSTGRSAHTYWVLKEPITPEQWEPLQKRLIAHCKSDPNCADLSRVMRLPGFFYINSDDQPSHLVEIVHESGNTYSADDIEACLPMLVPAEAPVRASNVVPIRPTGDLPPRPDGALEEALAKVPEFCHKQGRRKELVALAFRLIAEVGADAAHQLMAKHSPSLKDLAGYFTSEPDQINPGSIWPFLRDQYKIDISRTDLKAPPRPQRPHRPEPAVELQEEPSLSIEDIPDQQSLEKLKKVRKDHLCMVVNKALALRYNLLTNRIELDGEAIHGDFLNGLYLQLAEQHQLDIAKDRAIDAAIRVARASAYHPVRDYLNSLTVQLTPEDWAAIDVRCFGTEDPHGWAGVHLQRQLIALVARAMDPGCELHTCLVLQGDKQGIGKSTFWKILGGDWFSDSLGELKDIREDRLQLHSAWIHEWGEIDNVMGKRESETMKRFLSCRRDDVRRPYGRGTEQLLRSCGIVGTTNRRDFIKDPTGNRRYPIIQVSRVELEWVKANRDQIWGSALAAYKAGTQWHYDSDEGQVVSDQARTYAAEDPLRDAVETWAETHPQKTKVPTIEVLMDLGYEGDQLKDQGFRLKVSNVMTSLGWIRTDQRERFWLSNGQRTDRAWGWVRPN